MRQPAPRTGCSRCAGGGARTGAGPAGGGARPGGRGVLRARGRTCAAGWDWDPGRAPPRLGGLALPGPWGWPAPGCSSAPEPNRVRAGSGVGGSAAPPAELGGSLGPALGCFPNAHALFGVSGSGKESLDVRGKGGSGGPQRANQGADREELPAGARKHSAKNTRQPGAACPVPSTAADWFPAFLFPVARDNATACSAGITGVRAFSVVRSVIAVVIAGLWTARSKKDLAGIRHSHPSSISVHTATQTEDSVPCTHRERLFPHPVLRAHLSPSSLPSPFDLKESLFLGWLNKINFFQRISTSTLGT